MRLIDADELKETLCGCCYVRGCEGGVGVKSSLTPGEIAETIDEAPTITPQPASPWHEWPKEKPLMWDTYLVLYQYIECSNFISGYIVAPYNPVRDMWEIDGHYAVAAWMQIPGGGR